MSERRSIFSPENLIMGFLIAAMSWGSIMLMGMSAQNAVDAEINQMVRDSLPAIQVSLTEIKINVNSIEKDITYIKGDLKDIKKKQDEDRKKLSQNIDNVDDKIGDLENEIDDSMRYFDVPRKIKYLDGRSG